MLQGQRAGPVGVQVGSRSRGQALESDLSSLLTRPGPDSVLGHAASLFEPQFLWLENGITIVLHRVVVATVCSGVCKAGGAACSLACSKPSPRSSELPTDQASSCFQGHAAFLRCGV